MRLKLESCKTQKKQAMQSLEASGLLNLANLMIVWHEVIKPQLAAQIAANPTATTLTSLIGKL